MIKIRQIMFCRYYSLETPTINIFKNILGRKFYYSENEYYFRNLIIIKVLINQSYKLGYYGNR